MNGLHGERYDSTQSGKGWCLTRCMVSMVHRDQSGWVRMVHRDRSGCLAGRSGWVRMVHRDRSGCLAGWSGWCIATSQDAWLAGQDGASRPVRMIGWRVRMVHHDGSGWCITTSQDGSGWSGWCITTGHVFTVLVKKSLKIDPLAKCNEILRTQSS